jgi:hypothetical protein
MRRLWHAFGCRARKRNCFYFNANFFHSKTVKIKRGYKIWRLITLWKLVLTSDQTQRLMRYKMYLETKVMFSPFKLS